MANHPRLKLMVVGPGSPHVLKYLDLIDSCTHDITVLTPHPEKFPETVHCELVNFRLLHPFNWLSAPRRIKQLIGQHQPDVLHVHQANAYAFYTVSANRSMQVPLVLSVWGSDVLLSPKKLPFLKPLIRLCIRAAARITAGSETLAKATRDLVNDEHLRIKVCSFGVDPLRCELPKENIVYSNRNHRPLYRIDKVIQIFASFSASRPDENWKLILAGEGDLTPDLKNLVSELGIDDCVEFVGFIDHEANKRLYARSRVFISMPISDSAAISLLEAMYHDCIPVVSDLPAYHEWIRHGENGIIFTGGETNPIHQALELQADKVGAANRELVAKQALSPLMAEAFCSVLQEAFAGVTQL